MAITREKKTAIVSDIADLVGRSKLTVFAQINGLSVADAQSLRRQAKAGQTVVRVVKNRLVKLALKGDERFADTDLSALHGQLLYAFNADDELGSAKDLADFAKTHDSLKLIGGFDAEGRALSEAAVTQLAAIPGKDSLRAQLVGTIYAPVGGLVRALSGNISGLLTVLKARTEQLS